MESRLIKVEPEKLELVLKVECQMEALGERYQDIVKLLLVNS